MKTSTKIYIGLAVFSIGSNISAYYDNPNHLDEIHDIVLGNLIVFGIVFLIINVISIIKNKLSDKVKLREVEVVESKSNAEILVERNNNYDLELSMVTKQIQEVNEVYLIPFKGIFEGFYKFGITKNDVHKRYSADKGFKFHADQDNIKYIKVRSRKEAFRLESEIKTQMSTYIDEEVRILFDTKASEIMKLDSPKAINEFNSLVNALDLGEFFIEK